jgi:hypothetical protein
MDEIASAPRKPCATCLIWRVALAATAIALLVSWLAAQL